MTLLRLLIVVIGIASASGIDRNIIRAFILSETLKNHRKSIFCGILRVQQPPMVKWTVDGEKIEITIFSFFSG